MSGKSNWIFLLSLGSLGGCDDASSIPPCDPERLGRECNDVDPDASEGTPIDSNTSGASGSATSGADTYDSGNDTATASDTASASDTADSGTSGGDYGSTGYGSSGYGSSGSGSSGSGSSGSSSSGYYAQSDYAELGLADLEENGCLSGLDCGVLSEVRR